jgi:hypothetical protein
MNDFARRFFVGESTPQEKILEQEYADKKRKEQEALDAIAKAREIYGRMDTAGGKDMQNIGDRYKQQNNFADFSGGNLTLSKDPSELDALAKMYGGSRDAVAGNLGLKDKYADVPAVQALNKELEADKGRGMAQEQNFQSALGQIANSDVFKKRPDLLPSNMTPQAPRELANKYGFSASETPVAKEAMTNVEQSERLAQEERLKKQQLLDIEEAKQSALAAKNQELKDKQEFEAREAEKDRQNKIVLKGVGGGASGEPSKQDFTQEQQLRTQLAGRSKDFLTMRDAYSRIEEVSKGGAMSDISLIYQYMKMNDPGSTVREGEFATAQNAASVPSQIMNQYNKILKGERLNPEQRRQILDNSKKFYESAARIQDSVNSEYSKIAQDYGLKPERVVGGFSTKMISGGVTEKSTDKKALAQEALNDPSAPEAVKAQARKILGL